MAVGVLYVDGPVCFSVVCYRDNHKRQSKNKGMEKRNVDNGRVLAAPITIMGRNSSHIGLQDDNQEPAYKEQVVNSNVYHRYIGVLLSIFSSESIYSTQKLAKVATFKTIVFMSHFLGLTSLLYSVLLSVLPGPWLADIHLTDIREPFKSFIIVIGLIYGIIQCLRGWEAYRRVRIENNRKSFELKCEISEYEKENH